MMRLASLAFVGLTASSTVSFAAAVELEAFAVDDACLADPTKEDCGVSLRQLRGERILAEVAEHNATAAEETEASEAAPTEPAKAEETSEEPAKAEETSEEPAKAEETSEEPAKAEETSEEPAKAEETSEEPAKAEESSEEPAKAEETAEEPTGTEETAEEPTGTEETAEEPTGIEETAEEPSKAEEAPAESTDDEDAPGVCCYSASDKSDMCGTCYPTAIATDADCSKKSKCGSCGGTWCSSVCVMGAADPNDKCGTAFDTGLAKSDSYCGKNEKNCGSCNGEWCKSGTKKLKVKVAGSSVTAESAKSKAGGFCCYRGEGDDMCGACADVAKDATCSTESACGGCGGTWCPGPQCIMAYADKSDPCGSAYTEGGVAASSDYCAQSEANCGSCQGTWCLPGNVSYHGGGKPTWAVHDEEPKEEGEEGGEEAEEGEEGEEEEEAFPAGIPGFGPLAAQHKINAAGH